MSFFSVLGDSFSPKSFAGLFGAAPSIALAGLILAWGSVGANTVATEAYSMISGSIAMLVYSVTSTFIVRSTHARPWLVTGLLWLEWLGVALLFYWLLR